MRGKKRKISPSGFFLSSEINFCPHLLLPPPFIQLSSHSDTLRDTTMRIRYQDSLSEIPIGKFVSK